MGKCECDHDFARYMDMERCVCCNRKLRRRKNINIHFLYEQANAESEKLEKQVACLQKQLEAATEILAPHLDLLKIAEKHGTYQILLTYEQIKQLREVFGGQQKTEWRK